MRRGSTGSLKHGGRGVSILASELMRFPARDIPELLRGFHFLQESQNVADPLHDSRKS
jgi:hypothetical protein